MKFMNAIALALSLSSFAALADNSVILGLGCANKAAQVATDAVYAEVYEYGRWYIQDFKTLTFGNDFSFVMQNNSRAGSGKECARITVKGYAGATDCQILDVKIEALALASNGLCK